jgi:hypothetical protein
MSFCNLISNASAIIDAVSKSIFELSVTFIQFFINSQISFGIGTQIFSENSFKVNTSHKTIVSQEWLTRFCLISSIFFSSFLICFILFDLEKVKSSSSKNTEFLKYLEFLSFLKNFGFLSSSPPPSFFHFFFQATKSDLSDLKEKLLKSLFVSTFDSLFTSFFVCFSSVFANFSLLLVFSFLSLFWFGFLKGLFSLFWFLL